MNVRINFNSTQYEIQLPTLFSAVENDTARENLRWSPLCVISPTNNPHIIDEVARRQRDNEGEVYWLFEVRSIAC